MAGDPLHRDVTAAEAAILRRAALAKSEAERVCHEEQLCVWAEELVSDLAAGDFLREGMDYADGVDLHRAVMAEIKRIVTSAFEHPEATLRARVAELEAALREIVGSATDATDGNYWSPQALVPLAHIAVAADLLSKPREANMSGEATARRACCPCPAVAGAASHPCPAPAATDRSSPPSSG